MIWIKHVFLNVYWTKLLCNTCHALKIHSFIIVIGRLVPHCEYEIYVLQKAIHHDVYSNATTYRETEHVALPFKQTKQCQRVEAIQSCSTLFAPMKRNLLKKRKEKKIFFY